MQSKNFNININLNVEKIYRINVEINEICEINSVSQSFFFIIRCVYIQNPVSHLMWSVLWEKLTTEYRQLFFKKLRFRCFTGV